MTLLKIEKLSSKEFYMLEGEINKLKNILLEQHKPAPNGPTTGTDPESDDTLLKKSQTTPKRPPTVEITSKNAKVIHLEVFHSQK